MFTLVSWKCAEHIASLSLHSLVFTMDGIDIDEMDEDYESRDATRTSRKSTVIN